MPIESLPPVVSREQREAARKELLTTEKELTRRLDGGACGGGCGGLVGPHVVPSAGLGMLGEMDGPDMRKAR